MSLPASVQHFPQRILDAALLGCLFTALAFQSVRFEPYEAEKSGLLLVLAAVLFGALILRRAPSSSTLFRHPITLLLIALLAFAGISTLVAFSPAMSFWGAPYRSQGWLSLLAGLLIFFAAAQASPTLRTSISVALCLAVIPLCLLAWASFLHLDPTFPQTDRPSATTGNVNFLANWLAAALLLILPLLTTPGRLRVLALGTGVLILATLLMTVSRSALLSLVISALVGCLLYGALTRRRWVTLLVGAVGAVALGIYVVAGQTNASRLLNLNDPVRISIWADGVLLARQLNQPFVDTNNTPDRWAALRPLTGYGLDNLEQTFPRLVASRYYLGSWIDRFHNLLLDNLLSLGWPGLLLQVGLYAAALYGGLFALGLLPNRRQVVLWLAAVIGGASLGGLATAPLALDTDEYRAVALIAIGLGAVFGFAAWAALRGLLARTSASTQVTYRQWFILALLTFIIQQWITNQFHFQTVIGQPLWWIALGLLARESRCIPASADEPQPSGPVDNTVPFNFIAMPGLFLLNTLGTGLSNSFLTVQTGQWFTPIVLTLIMTAIGWWVLRPPRRFLRSLILLLTMDWIVVTLLRVIAGGLAENALANLSPLPLVLAAGLLSLIGVGTLGLVLFCLVRQSSARPVPNPPVSVHRWLVACLALGMGILLYAVPFTGSVLQKISDQVGGQNLPAAQMSADLALLYSSVRNRVYFDRAYLLLESNLPDRIPLARQEIDHLLQNEPFMANSREIVELLDFIGR